MDKASFHYSERISQICADAGVKLVYLQPYSPDLNPIEEFLLSWKASLNVTGVTMKRIQIKDLLPFSHGVLMWSVQKRRVLEAIFSTLAWRFNKPEEVDRYGLRGKQNSSMCTHIIFTNSPIHQSVTNQPPHLESTSSWMRHFLSERATVARILSTELSISISKLLTCHSEPVEEVWRQWPLVPGMREP